MAEEMCTWKHYRNALIIRLKKVEENDEIPWDFQIQADKR